MKLFKYIPILLTVLFIVLLSEILYLYNTLPSSFSYVFISKAELELKNENVEKIFHQINKIVFLHIKQNQINLKNEIADINILSLQNIDQTTKEEILKYLNSNLETTLEKNKAPLYSNLYYNIGLILYRNSYHEEANSLLAKASLLDPNLSFLYIELANSYFNDEMYDQGKQVLGDCMAFDSPRKHCQEYLQERAETQIFDQVGNLHAIIEEKQLNK